MNQLGLTHLSVRVQDVDAIAERIRELGGTVFKSFRTKLEENPDGSSSKFGVYCTDPDGVRIELMRLPDGAMAPRTRPVREIPDPWRKTECHKIRSIGALSAAKVMGALYFILGEIVAFFLALGALAHDSSRQSRCPCLDLLRSNPGAIGCARCRVQLAVQPNRRPHRRHGGAGGPLLGRIGLKARIILS